MRPRQPAVRHPSATRKRVTGITRRFRPGPSLTRRAGMGGARLTSDPTPHPQPLSPSFLSREGSQKIGRSLACLLYLVLAFVQTAGAQTANSQLAADSQAVAASPGSEVSPLAGPLGGFFAEHCIRCHSGYGAASDYHADLHLTQSLSSPAAAASWREVVNVLNSHQMPPTDEPQPTADERQRVVETITNHLAADEIRRRPQATVIRRLNRHQFQNTIRDLVGIDFDMDRFPQDPSAGGFDNNGLTLAFSPLQMELHYAAASEIIDRALLHGDQPPAIRWQFEPESGDSDSNRVTYDGQRLIVNGGNNRVEGDFVVMHHDNWDRKVNVRDFRLAQPGRYQIVIRAGGSIPDRQAVVAAAERFLGERIEREVREQPHREKGIRHYGNLELDHFRTDRRYDFGPPRLRVIQHLGGQPQTLAELDIDASPEAPGEYVIWADFSTESAGITLEYAYDIPKEVENFWLQTRDEFPRPEAWIDSITLSGPHYASWPPPAYRMLLPESSLQESDPPRYATEVLRRFMQRAYRRPVTADELAGKRELFDGLYQASGDFHQAIRAPLIATLVSPHFLYLAEPLQPLVGQTSSSLTLRVTTGEDSPRTESAGSRRLSDYELASRLSYFLWSSMPDDDLFRSAARGELSDRAKRLEIVERMLADPKAEALVSDFASQWLGLREVGANPPAPDLFRHYDRHLETSIVGESQAFFREILQQDLDLMNFIDSDFVTINERLARFYEMSDVRGDHFRRVPLADGTPRGGLLTQAAMLTTTSNGTRTSPVKRGTWILKTILGTDPGLPVAGVGEIAPKVPGIDKATVRQRLEIHRELPQCARCHDRIDPLGFALENYDASGFWRQREGFGYQGRIGDDDPLIDASSRLPDGTPIDGIEGLKAALLKQEDAFLRCLVEKMLTYALGRELSWNDLAAVPQAVEQLQTEERTLRQLIRWIVASPAFESR